MSVQNLLPEGQFFFKVVNDKLSSENLKPGDSVRFDVNKASEAKPGDLVVTVDEDNHEVVKIMAEGDKVRARAVQYQFEVRNKLTGE